MVAAALAILPAISAVPSEAASVVAGASVAGPMLRIADEAEPRHARPKAAPLPGQGDASGSARRPQRPGTPRDSEPQGPIGCPDRQQKLELIV